MTEKKFEKCRRLSMRLCIFVSKCFAVVGINVLRLFFSVFHNVKTLSDATQPPVYWVPWFLPGDKAARGVKLITHLHLAPR